MKEARLHSTPLAHTALQTVSHRHTLHSNQCGLLSSQTLCCAPRFIQWCDETFLPTILSGSISRNLFQYPYSLYLYYGYWRLQLHHNVCAHRSIHVYFSGSLEGHHFMKDDYAVWTEDDMSLGSNDLYVSCQVMSGSQKLTLPVQTSYKSFTNRLK